MLSLDTNVVIGILTGRSPQARLSLVQARMDRLPIYVSSVVVLELWYGAERSARPAQNKAMIEEFLDSPIEVLAFNGEDARKAGEIRAILTRLGMPIGPIDTQIAGQALARGLAVVTDNEREFRRVPGLDVVNWIRDPR